MHCQRRSNCCAGSVPESYELQLYQESWSERRDWESRRKEFFPDPNGFLSFRVLRQIRQLRNVATHRSDLDKWDTMGFFKNAIILANFIDDRVRAAEIEILAEEWFTARSRSEVLTRLREVLLDDYCTFDDFTTEEGRRAAIRERRRRFTIVNVLIHSSFNEARSASRFVRTPIVPSISVIERHVP